MIPYFTQQTICFINLPETAYLLNTLNMKFIQTENYVTNVGKSLK